VTIEDIIETLLGLEIVDEFDNEEDMQAHARKIWKVRAEKLGLPTDPNERFLYPSSAASVSR